MKTLATQEAAMERQKASLEKSKKATRVDWNALREKAQASRDANKHNAQQEEGEAAEDKQQGEMDLNFENDYDDDNVDDDCYGGGGDDLDDGADDEGANHERGSPSITPGDHGRGTQQSGQWQIVWSDVAQRPFYFNPVTCVGTFKRPAEIIE